MRAAHSVEHVRSAEQTLMQTLPPGTLMQRAAAGLAAACADALGQVYGARVLLVVGTGDNGGDALYAGARLARRGADVSAVLTGERAHQDALTELLSAGGRVVTDPHADVDLAVDGIVGIGGSGGLRGRAAELVADLRLDRLDRRPRLVVAVDVPSGVEVDTGEVHGLHVHADVTVTFGTYKAAHFVDPAAAACGAVELVDIGLTPYLPDPLIEVLQSADVGRLLPQPEGSSQKYSRGVLGVAAGSAQYPGAAVLVTSAAVDSGLAGMVRYDGASADLVRQRTPEVVIGSGQVQAWVAGPGLGDESDDRVHEVLAEGLPTLIDADGLRALPDRCGGQVVLTPHAGELARMLDRPRAEVEAAMLTSAREAADRWNAVVLLKGSHSVIAAPDGRARVNTTGVPWLATAGAGDVLSGLTGALLAAGLDCFDAASVGAWVHGAAGTLASAGGPLSALSVAAALPDVVRQLLCTMEMP
jgi:ADP-dependent NAD(P)H-hydrate dehydratase / NAD(P)H-hydrate epimerase